MCKIKSKKNLFLFLFFVSLKGVNAENKQINIDLLKKRGLDPALLNYFSKSKRFLPGNHTVNLIVNGNNKGRIRLTFGGDGEVCLNKGLLDALNLKNGEKIRLTQFEQDNKCIPFKKYIINSTVSIYPDDESVEIIVPPNLLKGSMEAGSSNENMSSENGDIINYGLVASESKTGYTENKYSHEDIEFGGNFNNWVIRSHNIFSQENGNSNSEALNSYIQRNILNDTEIIKFGLINMDSPIFSSGNIIGFQVFSEKELLPDEQSGVTVSGIARTSQARVEIRQAGRLIYSTLVNAGPFNIDNVDLIRRNVDLDVQVKESDNSVNHFIISKQFLNKKNIGPTENLKISAGQWHDDTSNGKKYGVVSISDGKRINDSANILTAGVLANSYIAIGEQGAIQLSSAVNVSDTIKISTDNNHNVSGGSNELRGNFDFLSKGNLTLAVANYTKGYRELTDIFDEEVYRNKYEYSTGMGWSTNEFGAFNASYNYSKGITGHDDYSSIYFTWGRTFKQWSLSVSYQQQLNVKNKHQYDKDDLDNKRFFINIHIPFGRQSLSTYVQKNKGNNSFGTQFSGELNEDNNYTLSASNDNNSSFNGNLISNLHYTKLSAGGGKGANSESNFASSLSGGIAYHQKKLYFSPSPIKDTFGLLNLSAPASGVEFLTPSGKVWSDCWGHAIIPSLTPYHTNDIFINNSSLPDGMVVKNKLSNINAIRGAVYETNLNLAKVNHVILDAVYADGRPIPKGGVITDRVGMYVTTVIDDGIIFLQDFSGDEQLNLVNKSGHILCKLIINLQNKDTGHSSYVHEKGVCR